ncbi:MAG: V-type ATPase subunit [Candidatus Woesearchaeota archaeon]
MNVIIGIGALLVLIAILIYPAFRVLHFAYGAARMRAAQGKLIRSDELLSLSSQRSYKDIIYQLERRGFKELLELKGSDYREELAQGLLRRHFNDNLKKIIASVPPKYKPFFLTLAKEEDIRLINTVKRVKKHDRTGLISGMFSYTPGFSRKTIQEIDSMSLDEFYLICRKAGYPTEDLYQWFFDSLRSFAVDEVLLSYTKLLIDVHNVTEALSQSFNFIEGGKHDDVLLQLKDASVDDVINALEKTPFHCENVFCIMRKILNVKKSFAQKLKGQDPLSIKPFITYHIEKELELKNIRVLLKLVHSRATPEHIEEVLV